MALKIIHQTLSSSGEWWVITAASGVSGGTITVVEGTQQQVQLLIGTHQGPYPSLAAADSAATVTQKSNQTVGGSLKAGASSIVPDILGGLNLGNLILRIGEVILGVVLVGVGMAKITGAENLISKALK